MGAGIAGVAASILISRKVKNLSYTVYERQDTVVSFEHFTTARSAAHERFRVVHGLKIDTRE